MTVRKVLVRLGIALGVLLALLVATVGVTLLYEKRFWPFSTGTKISAFWGSTFEMSPPEVSRATGLILHSDPPPKDPDDPLSYMWSFQYADPEIEALTMHRTAYPVSLFEQPGMLRFEFFDDRLVGIDGAFHPWKSDRERFVNNLIEAMTGRFGTPKKVRNEKEPRTDYEWENQDVNAFARVEDAPDKTVNFSIQYAATKRRFDTRRRERDSNAFGR